VAIASTASVHEPLSDINTTPLIDVLLVLLIMIIMSIPIKPHSLEVPLPQPGELPPLPNEPDKIRNKVMLTTDGTILWNGDQVSQGELSALLRRTTEYRIEPELQFEPEANASYELAANVVNTIVDSGVTKFGFVGNERYREFARD
jgi:biopolymer transport protein ExbD